MTCIFCFICIIKILFILHKTIVLSNLLRILASYAVKKNHKEDTTGCLLVYRYCNILLCVHGFEPTITACIVSSSGERTVGVIGTGRIRTYHYCMHSQFLRRTNSWCYWNREDSNLPLLHA